MTTLVAHHISQEPPQNLVAEQALLGIILQRNDAFDAVAHTLRAEHFADPLHGRIYAQIERMVREGKPANAVTLKPIFDQDSALIGAGGAAYLVRLYKEIIPVPPANLADDILDLAKRRLLIGMHETAAREARIIDPSVTVDQQIAASESQLAEIGAQGLMGEEARSLGQGALLALEHTNEAHKRGGVFTGVRSGLTQVDKMIGGFQPGDMVVLAARPSMGKTALASSSIIFAAHRDQTKILFFQLEMSLEQMSMRHQAMETGISAIRQRNGYVNQDEVTTLLESQRYLDTLPIKIDDTPGLTMQQIEQRARRYQRRHGVDAVVIDHMGLIQPAGRQVSLYEHTTATSKSIKAMAKRLKVPVIALCQLSRANEKRDDKRPSLSDLRDSGSIEQDADVVAFVHREEYYLERSQPKKRPDEDSLKFSARMDEWSRTMEEHKGKADIIIAKQRMGPIGTVQVAFDGVRTKFSDLAQGEA